MSMRVVRLAGAALVLYLFAGHAPVLAQGGRPEHWVGTWATAVVARPPVTPAAGRGPAPLNFNNQTLRQIVHTSLGGDRVRIVLSNAFGTMPLPVGAASVALRQKESSIVVASRRPLTFGGATSTTVAAGAIAVSDPVNLAVPAFADLAIDIFLPGDTTASPSPLTTHNGALQTSYISMPGNHAGEGEWTSPSPMQAWFFL